MALVENIQRQELNPIEEAVAYKRLIESLGLTQEEVAQRVGRDRTFVTNYLRVLKLPTDIQKLIETDKLSSATPELFSRSTIQWCSAASHTRSPSTSGPSETEQRVKTLTHPPEPRAPKTIHSDPNVRAAEAKLRRALGTQVRIQPAKPGTPGRIEIEYYSMEDLDRIYTQILHEKEAMVASS